MTESSREPLKIPEHLQKLRVKPLAKHGFGGYFSCKSGDNLYYRVWPSDDTQKIVLCIHGLGMHGEYYVQVADQLVSHQITVYALDLKHHGKSTGRKGDIKNFKELIEQTNEFIVFLNTKHGNKPIFLMGLSMGGCLAVNYAVMYPKTLKGIILMAPAVATKVKLSALLILALPLIGLFYLVRKGKPLIDTSKRQGEYTRNPLRKKYDEQDELQTRKVSLRYLFSVNKWIKKAFKKAGKISCSVLIMQGTDDKLVPLDKVREFFAQIPIEDKRLIEIEGAYHSLFSDPAMLEKNGWDSLRIWINKH